MQGDMLLVHCLRVHRVTRNKRNHEWIVLIHMSVFILFSGVTRTRRTLSSKFLAMKFHSKSRATTRSNSSDFFTSVE